jgi:hypothetical protein
MLLIRRCANFGRKSRAWRWTERGPCVGKTTFVHEHGLRLINHARRARDQWRRSYLLDTTSSISSIHLYKAAIYYIE